MSALDVFCDGDSVRSHMIYWKPNSQKRLGDQRVSLRRCGALERCWCLEWGSWKALYDWISQLKPVEQTVVEQPQHDDFFGFKQSSVGFFLTLMQTSLPSGGHLPNLTLVQSINCPCLMKYCLSKYRI